MSEDKSKSPKAEQVMDVSHPGKTAPTGNSKSVILTHRAVIQDPMVTATSEKGSDLVPVKRTAPLLKSDDEQDSAHKELHLQPPSSVSVDNDPAETAEESVPQPTPEAETLAPKTETRDDNKAETIGEVSKDGKTAKALPTDDELEAGQLEKDATLQKVIDSKKYYLPINTLEKQRTKRFIALGALLSLILVAAWVDISLDAGLLHINGLRALTHFFST